MRLPGKIFALSLALFVLSPALAYAEIRHAEVIKLHDGDTLVVRLGGRRRTVRVLGMDTMELRYGRHQTRQARYLGISSRRVRYWALAAKRRARELCGESVKLLSDRRQPPRDVHGRLLAHVVLADGSLLSARLVGEGLATVYRRYSFKYKKKLLKLERRARRAGRGFWGEARRR